MVVVVSDFFLRSLSLSLFSGLSLIGFLLSISVVAVTNGRLGGGWWTDPSLYVTVLSLS
jgi:hypothetical protein